MKGRFTSNERRSDEKVRSFVEGVDCHTNIAVRASYGLGKTYYGMRPLIQKCNARYETVLFVTEKVSLAHHLTATLGLENYNDIHGTISPENNHSVAVQLDSLHPIHGHYDTIVLDEHRSLLSSMTNPTMLKNCTLVIATLITQLRHAKNIIIADADLSDECVELIKKVASKKFHEINYTHKNLKDNPS